MNQEMHGFSKQKQEIHTEQNKVRLAVHAFLAMDDLTPGIGKEVSEIARHFNNSVQVTIHAEERLNSRSRIARFFIGGDADTATELEAEVNANMQRVHQLKQLKEQCNCTDEVRTLMQEQIQNMEQEQTRLQQLAQKEKKSKGLFGWLWK